MVMGTSKKGIAVNELMGWIIIIFVIFVIVVIVGTLSGKFDVDVLQAIG